jgi:predicted CxxxxCH...CXXCH cytochrome family protein
MFGSQKNTWLSAALLLAALGASSCLDPRQSDGNDPNACIACHGSADRSTGTVDNAAPPLDLSGNSDVIYPGVGAHQIHLQPAETHAAIQCTECHIVPERTDTPGHADDPLPAELTFGALAKTGGRSPSYSATARSCSDTYCHREAEARWTEPRSSDAACGSCHGLPPATPDHPQSPACATCHGMVVDADRKIIAPSLHVNGTVEVAAAGCSLCHGSQQNEAPEAPPVDLSGNTERTARGVGAHQVHLAGGMFSRALDCNECHDRPESVSDPGHLNDSTPGAAEVVLTGVSENRGATPMFDPSTLRCASSWCHGPSDTAASLSPEWTSTESLGCTSCHELPPPLPHPPIDRCALCHGAVVGADHFSIENRDLHVDGMLSVDVPSGCTACHGSAASPAPPIDLSGATETTAPGVGAHQKHLFATIARPVLCGECHIEPGSVFAPGHMDSARPAELVFSGVAVSFGANPSYDGNSCANTYCHGAVFITGGPSGGTHTEPVWTAGSSQTGCTGCHGLPPPPPHPVTDASCASCHPAANDPMLHVNGIVEPVTGL